MVTYQAMSESMGWLPIVGCWLRTGKNSRVSHSKVKGLFREETYSIDRVWAVSEGKRGRRGPRVMGLSVFIGVGNFIG